MDGQENKRNKGDYQTITTELNDYSIDRLVHIRPLDMVGQVNFKNYL